LDAPRREPNPRPLLIVLLIVGFFGDSCALQSVIGASGQKPTEQDVSKYLSERGLLPEDPAAAAGATGSARTFLEEQSRVLERYQPYATGFGLLLVAAYTFVLVFGVRAYHWAPGSAKALAKVAILVLPARVAIAAVELADARALQPAMHQLFLAVAQGQKTKLATDQEAVALQIFGNVAPWLLVAVPAATALIVCVLFQQASRYFQKPEVLALFERKAPPDPDPLA